MNNCICSCCLSEVSLTRRWPHSQVMSRPCANDLFLASRVTPVTNKRIKCTVNKIIDLLPWDLNRCCTCESIVNPHPLKSNFRFYRPATQKSKQTDNYIKHQCIAVPGEGLTTGSGSVQALLPFSLRTEMRDARSRSYLGPSAHLN